MTIQVGDTRYELSTKLGAVKRLEAKFEKPLPQVMAEISSASLDHLMDLVAVATAQDTREFRDALIEHWDYSDLQGAAMRALSGMLFSGTAEEQQRKIDEFPADDESKNAIRGLLGLPIKPAKK